MRRMPVILGGRGTKNGLPYLQPGISYIHPDAVIGPMASRKGFSVATGGNISDVLLTCLRCFDPAANDGAATSVGDVTLSTPPPMPIGSTGFGIPELINPDQP
jgi:hypothetical protein